MPSTPEYPLLLTELGEWVNEGSDEATGDTQEPAEQAHSWEWVLFEHPSIAKKVQQ